MNLHHGQPFPLDSVEPLAILHSGRPHEKWAKHTMIGKPTCWYIYDMKLGSQIKGMLPRDVEIDLTGNVFQDLRAVLNHPKLTGHWIGYIGYEIAHLVEKTKLPYLEERDDRHWPIVAIGYCDRLNTLPAGKGFIAHTDFQAQDANSAFTRKEYEEAVERIKSYIAQGDVFQANLTQRYTAAFSGSTRRLFSRLSNISPAWYGAYLELPDGRAICSTSPELFIDLKEDREIITRPIKGTRPAYVDAIELATSEKDHAELNMIVDLMRNDIGRVCEYGSVKVLEPRTIESHPTVHHSVATISGKLHEQFDTVDVIKATMPGGSITGAPKVRAMQILQQIEPVVRGPYCGCIGWLKKDTMCLNIAIRTICANPREGYVDFAVGGGIVADSVPEEEFKETLDKARAMLRALSKD